jgi:hypothetical protein
VQGALTDEETILNVYDTVGFLVVQHQSIMLAVGVLSSITDEKGAYTGITRGVLDDDDELLHLEVNLLRLEHVDGHFVSKGLSGIKLQPIPKHITPLDLNHAHTESESGETLWQVKERPERLRGVMEALWLQVLVLACMPMVIG